MQGPETRQKSDPAEIARRKTELEQLRKHLRAQAVIENLLARVSAVGEFPVPLRAEEVVSCPDIGSIFSITPESLRAPQPITTQNMHQQFAESKAQWLAFLKETYETTGLNLCNPEDINKLLRDQQERLAKSLQELLRFTQLADRIFTNEEWYVQYCQAKSQYFMTRSGREINTIVHFSSASSEEEMQENFRQWGYALSFQTSLLGIANFLNHPSMLGSELLVGEKRYSFRGLANTIYNKLAVNEDGTPKMLKPTAFRPAEIAAMPDIQPLRRLIVEHNLRASAGENF